MGLENLKFLDVPQDRIAVCYFTNLNVEMNGSAGKSPSTEGHDSCHKSSLNSEVLYPGCFDYLSAQYFLEVELCRNLPE